MVTSFVMFLIAGAMAVLIRVQLAVPNNDFVSLTTYNQLFTIHGTIMLFLFLGLFAFGTANYLVPIQIGAPDMAFPRFNAFSYWLFLGGCVTIMSSFLTSSGAAAWGWFAYAPLTESIHSPGPGGDLWIVGVALAAFSSMFTGINLITTVFCLRAPGMVMFRMPVFVWNQLVTAFLVLLAFPVLTAAIALLWADRHLGTNFYNPARAGSRSCGRTCSGSSVTQRSTSSPCPSSAWRRKSSPRSAQARVRLQGHGVRDVGDRWPVHGRVGAPYVHHRRRAPALLRHHVVAYICAHRHQVLQLDRHDVPGVGPARLADVVRHRVPRVLPARGPHRGHARPAAPQLPGTRHLLRRRPLPLRALRGSVFAAFGAIHYWFPKFTGKKLDERLGKITFVIMFIGFNLTFFPHTTSGCGDATPHRYLPFQRWSGASQICLSIRGLHPRLSVLPFPGKLWETLRKGKKARAEPLGWHDPGMGHRVAPVSGQLRVHTADPVREAGVGPQPSRPPHAPAQSPRQRASAGDLPGRRKRVKWRKAPLSAGRRPIGTVTAMVTELVMLLVTEQWPDLLGDGDGSGGRT